MNLQMAACGCRCRKPTRFESWYRAARQRLVVAVFASTKSRAEAEDAVDEAMVKAVTRWTEVSEMRNPASWAYRTALNISRRSHRRNERSSWHRWLSGIGGLSCCVTFSVTPSLRLLVMSACREGLCHHGCGGRTGRCGLLMKRPAIPLSQNHLWR
jgi:hypothetical protein